MNIPIIIISYNNYKYVDNMLNQIIKISKDYYDNILILDNNSNCIDTINYLKTTNTKVIHRDNNLGPWISPLYNTDIYNNMPDKFIVTDPDLELNTNLPNNFIDILVNLSDKYQTNKIGFSLDISDYDKMYHNNYFDNKNIYDWEIQFWDNKIYDPDYELYNAQIDTTFCLINKNFINNNIRIGKNFTAKHLPWYKNNKIYNIYDNYILNKKTTIISTTSQLVNYYIDYNYIKITKNNETFFIKNTKDDMNLFFWKDIYINWENETFDIFDKFFDKNKIFIDIGGWIGTTSMYGCRKSKHTYSIEADRESYNNMSSNLEINCNNYTLINKAIFNINNITIKFGKNKFLNNSKMNDSTSQIYNDNDISDEYHLIQTITLQNIIEDYNINPIEISLIKVDIEGGEEYILDDLYNIHKEYKIPLYISFHYTWWKNQNLERFNFLTIDNLNNIKSNPFTSILFVL